MFSCVNIKCIFGCDVGYCYYSSLLQEKETITNSNIKFLFSCSMGLRFVKYDFFAKIRIKDETSNTN